MRPVPPLHVRPPVLPAAALLAMLAAPAFAQPTPGVYNLTGTNPDGSAYAGQVWVIDRGRGTFQVDWDVAGSRIRGWGMGAGDSFAASYVLEGRVGVALYRRQGNAWRGTWSVAGSDPGTEVLTPR